MEASRAQPLQARALRFEAQARCQLVHARVRTCEDADARAAGGDGGVCVLLQRVKPLDRATRADGRGAQVHLGGGVGTKGTWNAERWPENRQAAHAFQFCISLRVAALAQVSAPAHAFPSRSMPAPGPCAPASCAHLGAEGQHGRGRPAEEQSRGGTHAVAHHQHPAVSGHRLVQAPVVGGLQRRQVAAVVPVAEGVDHKQHVKCAGRGVGARRQQRGAVGNR